MKKTKIDWCDCTVNPVVGCPNGCKYCYARKLNARFKWIDDWGKPQFFPERIKEFYSKKPRSIFIDSMSDIGTWRQEWFNAVMDAMRANPQHCYIALTKQKERLDSLFVEYCKVRSCEAISLVNIYFGVSVTKKAQIPVIGKSRFFSIEPILEPIAIPAEKMPKLLIVGAETGNRKGKVIPQKEWIDDLVRQADEHHSAVFMKESLRQLMGDDFRQDKLPWDIERSAE